MNIRLALLLAALCTIVPLQADTTTRRPVRPPLLASGITAPDFAVLQADLSPINLSAFRGKVVLVDFWSTWCGPCKMTMPHLEQLHRTLEAQGLVVLGVCTWDSRANFAAWLQAPQVPTSYLKVFDPAGQANAESIARKHYRVSSIPTFYLIDREGKIIFAGAGASPRTEAALDQALVNAGFKL